jgi:hypothetical protein
MVKTVLLLAFLSAASAQASSGLEEQRPYTVETHEGFDLGSGLGPFSFERHSTYHVFDIYFDTPSRRLEHEGYSMRLRRTEKGPGKIEYGIQLKSEMTRPGEIRMEVEWKDFALEEADGRPMRAVIDAIAARGRVTEREGLALSDWFKSKMESAEAPFQELRHRGLNGEPFAPRIVGTQERVRYHVFVDRRTVRGELAALGSSERTKADVPASIVADPARVWLMEASLDTSRFTPASPGKVGEHRIRQLELENKYRPRARGTALMDRLEALLKKSFPISNGQASKYLQTVSHLDQEAVR